MAGVITASQPSWIVPFNGLSPRRFGTLVTQLRHEGADAVRRGRPWSLPLPHMPANRGRGGRWQCHRRVINGILFRQRTGLPWRDLPACSGSWKTVHDRHRRWSADGTWERILRAVQADADTEGRIDWSMVSVDSTTCRAHQHAAGASTRAPKIPGRRRSPARHRSDEALGRSRTRPDHVGGDKAYSSRRNRRHLRRRHIKHTLPEPRDQRANRQRRGSQGGRPTGFDKTIYRRRNEVERTINRFKNFRAVATRFDKRA
ncbi:IS5 family transposase [Streptomyces gardneri]|uniref:IS5 family transposase n=1 Tax=Streptomyces gardneri TaxID=66892 RepID=UPI001E46AF59|nr:IS5 family transposase [Streptomyces gardneri]